MAESGEDSSAHSPEGEGNKTLKLEEKEDRISDLPDSMIHHILSFLPSTKQMIQTGILSKRWLHQWTLVPVLIFDDKDTYMFINSALKLYDCSKVKSFELHASCRSGYYHQHIHFAILRNVEDLFLDFAGNDEDYELPNFLFNSPSLVELGLCHCHFVSDDLKVNFKSLKVLEIHWSKFGDGVIENVLRGCPVLETLDLSYCHGFKQLVVASKSLKDLSLEEQRDPAHLIEIECPNLEKFVLGCLDVVTFRLKLPSLVWATLYADPIMSDGFNEDSTKLLLKEFPHVEELVIFDVFMKTALQVGGLSLPLNCKSLTLVYYQFGVKLPEIKYALCNSSLLEELVIELRVGKERIRDLPGLFDFEETYRQSNGIGYTCLRSHLKTVKIIGLSNEKHKTEDVLLFVGFLLNNARVLEKMVVKLADGGTEFLAEVSEKLFKFPRCSAHCIVEVLELV